MAARFRKFFRAQAKRVLAEFDRTPASAWGKSIKAAPKVPVNLIFDAKGEAVRIHSAIVSDIQRVLSAGIGQTIGELAWDDSAFGVSDPACAAWLRDEKGTAYWAGADAPNATTVKRLHRTLAEGMETGESLAALRARITGVFDAAKGARAATIAITEVGGAYEAGGHLTSTAFTGDTGAKVEKHWDAARDSGTRETHAAAGAANGWIPEDRAFFVGGASLMYPGDPSGPASETVNCRCTVGRRVKRR